MIDTLDRELPAARQLPLPQHLAPDSYVVVTLHRPANVDDPQKLAKITRAITAEADRGTSFFWPVHPRTRGKLEEFDLLSCLEAHPNIILERPIGYHALLRLNLSAKAFLTDSGGLQEECCVVGTSCVTLRDNTERPITLVENGGTNVLASLETLEHYLEMALSTPRKPYRPENWDGRTAPRMVKTLVAG